MSVRIRTTAPARAATTRWDDTGSGDETAVKGRCQGGSDRLGPARAVRVSTIRVASPVGPLYVTEEAGAITCLTWKGAAQGPETSLLAEARAQLDAYFTGTRREFDLPLRVSGSDFQRAVCDAMRAIPFGETRTYGDIAAELNASPQAVGQACGANPIPVIIPCHRVLGAASLGGFSGAGGVDTKVALLRHEGAAGLLL